MSLDYSVNIVWSDEDNAFLSSVNELPGCMADGATREESLANLKVIISEWVETAKEKGIPVPKPMNVVDYARFVQESREKLRL